MYNFIVNPKTGRKVSIHGKVGKKVINQYINNMEGSGPRLAFMTYGRFQPPHRSHGELIDLIIEKSKLEEADAFLFTSQKDNDFSNPKKAKSCINSRSESAKKKKIENPLNITDKLNLLNKLHGHKDINIVNVVDENITSPFGAAAWLIEKGYEKVVFLVGTDRFLNFQKAFRRQEFDNVEVRELFRSEDGISGTEVREIALDTIFEFISRFDEINRIANNISEDEMKNLENIIKLYSKIKGKDKCYKNLDRIFKLFNNSDDETCDENIQLIGHIVDLIKKGSDPEIGL